MCYYDLKRNWRRVKPHLDDPVVADILVRDFNKFTHGRWGKPFLRGMVPHDFESCDWWCDHCGRLPTLLVLRETRSVPLARKPRTRTRDGERAQTHMAYHHQPRALTVAYDA